MSQPSEAWKTPEIREAEAALDRSVSKSRQLLKDLEKFQAPPAEPPVTPERIAALKAAASRPDAPPQLRLIKRKVEAGELSWEDVASGRAFADPDVRALASAQLGEARESYQEIREGATPDEVREARMGGGPADPLADTGRSPYSAGPAPETGYSTDNPLAGSSRQPEPPAAEPAPGRHRAEPRWEDDDFADPLAEEKTPPKSAPPRRRDEPPPDDDYFGSSFLG